MNLGDPELELIDPTPNVHLLFIHFDKMFFWTKLASRAVVRWSKRMYSCAGICSYEGRGGLCDIALSEPLLKLRPRKDLIETLIHEMIHAYLFVTGNDRDRDGHGPNFQSHMNRINKATGLNISIYHSFHDEVKLYQTHWWRCNGPCQQKRPYFGIVRRSMNRAPGPTDYWWDDHKRKCGGNFTKIKEPEKQGKKNAPPKPMGDITKFINNGTKTTNNLPGKQFTKSNGGNTVVVTKKNIVFNPKPEETKKPIAFEGKGHTLVDNNNKKSIDNVVDTVRNIWASKQTLLTNNINVNLDDISKKVKEVWANKGLDKNANVKKTNNKRASTVPISPPMKVTKIDDYFKTKATNILKDVYGEDFGIHQKCNDSKYIAIQNPNEALVSCPICKVKVKNAEINNHIDECLNKEEINRLSALENQPSTSKASIDIESNLKIKTEVNLSIEDDKIPKIVIDEERDMKQIKKEPVIIPEITEIDEQKCPCCGNITTKPMEEHLDECLAFFDNNTTIPEEDASTSFTTIVLGDDDEDDIMDESQTFNATGTKSPCPVCLTMVEQTDMNSHLDDCLKQ